MKLVVVAFAAALCACQAVPDVVYDGGVDGGTTCPDTTPSFATACCGPIACGGSNCNDTSCADCQNNCKLDELCCPNAQFRATCKPSTSPCP